LPRIYFDRMIISHSLSSHSLSQWTEGWICSTERKKNYFPGTRFKTFQCSDKHQCYFRPFCFKSAFMKLQAAYRCRSA